VHSNEVLCMRPARSHGREIAHLEAQGGLGGHSSAQHVTSSEVAQAVLVLDAGALSSLATAGRSCKWNGGALSSLPQPGRPSGQHVEH
jgi:hypothetical protein